MLGDVALVSAWKNVAQLILCEYVEAVFAIVAYDHKYHDQPCNGRGFDFSSLFLAIEDHIQELRDVSKLPAAAAAGFYLH